jgi:deazaflavin-dependent oxidoreductase (nitroreductase family)
MASTIAERLARVAGQQTLKLTHHGRRTGKPYEVVIWFMVDGDKLYLATANVNRNWVRNVKKDPKVLLRVGGETFSGQVRPISDPAEREHVQSLVQQKYWYVLPLLLTARVLTAFGILTDHTGAFEVLLDAGA